MTKRFFRWAGKAVGAGLVAFVLICLFCCLYYNVPVHYPNPSGATDYKWEPDRFYSKGTEGFALGRTNNDGFNDLQDYTPGEKIDILLMGSSHMEAFNVAQDENAAAVLNTLFGGERRVYNIGTAGHTLLQCVNHLDSALTYYAPSQYVLLETCELSFPLSSIREAIDGTLPVRASHTGGLITALQKLPFLRLLYTKYVKPGNDDGNAAVTADADEPELTPEQYEQAMDALTARIAQLCAAHHVTPILIYDPPVLPDADGKGYTAALPGQRETLAQVCAKNGVLLVDLTERYLFSMEEEGVFPFGFSNTEPGNAHMNRRGHRLFAEAACRLIQEREG